MVKYEGINCGVDEEKATGVGRCEKRKYKSKWSNLLREINVKIKREFFVKTVR